MHFFLYIIRTEPVKLISTFIEKFNIFPRLIPSKPFTTACYNYTY